MEQKARLTMGDWGAGERIDDDQARPVGDDFRALVRDSAQGSAVVVLGADLRHAVVVRAVILRHTQPHTERLAQVFGRHLAGLPLEPAGVEDSGAGGQTERPVDVGHRVEEVDEGERRAQDGQRLAGMLRLRESVQSRVDVEPVVAHEVEAVGSAPVLDERGEEVRDRRVRCLLPRCVEDEDAHSVALWECAIWGDIARGRATRGVVAHGAGLLWQEPVAEGAQERGVVERQVPVVVAASDGGVGAAGRHEDGGRVAFRDGRECEALERGERHCGDLAPVPDSVGSGLPAAAVPLVRGVGLELMGEEPQSQLVERGGIRVLGLDEGEDVRIECREIGSVVARGVRGCRHRGILSFSDQAGRLRRARWCASRRVPEMRVG